MAAMYAAMQDKPKPDPKGETPAGLEAKIARAVRLLDEEHAFWWAPGGFLTAITSEDADFFELDWKVRMANDTWKDIDQRLAEAYYETRTFADFIGAGIMEDDDG